MHHRSESPLPQDGARWPDLQGLHVWEELDPNQSVWDLYATFSLNHIDISYEIFINKCSLCLCPTGLPTLFFLSATVLYEIDYCAPGK